MIQRFHLTGLTLLIFSLIHLAETSCTERETDLMLIIDTSGRSHKVFQQQKELALRIVDAIPEDTTDDKRVSVSLVTFNAVANLALSFKNTKSKKGVMDTIRSINYDRGSGALALAALTAAKEIKTNSRPGAQQLVVILSDGKTHDPWHVARAMSFNLLGTGATVYSVTYAKLHTSFELELYAGSAERVYLSDAADSFLNMFERFINAEDCEVRTCDHKVDLMILMDTSGSTRNVFTKHQDLLIEMINSLPKGSLKSDVAVSFIRFSDVAHLDKSFKSFQNKDELIAHVKSINFARGSTQLAFAALLASSEIAENRRPDAATVVVILSDGKSEDPWDIARAAGRSLRSVDPAVVYAISYEPSVAEVELKEYTGSGDTVYIRENAKNFLPAFKNEVCGTV